jgi:hypothetical protein
VLRRLRTRYRRLITVVEFIAELFVAEVRLGVHLALLRVLSSTWRSTLLLRFFHVFGL